MEKEKEENIEVKKKRSLLNKIFRTVLYVFLGIIGLNVLIYLLLWVPFIQQWAKDFAIEQLKPIVKTELSIDRIQLAPFYNLQLEGVYLEDQQKDTLLYAKDLHVDFKPLSLLHNQLVFEKIELSDFVINVSQQHPDSTFNFQFLIDAFASDSTEETSEPSSLAIIFKDIELLGGRLNYDIKSEEQTPGVFNASHINLGGLNARASLNSIDISKLDIDLKSLSFDERSGISLSNLEARVKSKGDSIYWSKLELKLPNSALNLSNGYYNLKTNKIDVGINPSQILPYDLRPFLLAGDAAAQKTPLDLRGHITAKLPMIKIDSVLLTRGDDIYLKGNAYLEDYSKYHNSDISLNIEQLMLSPDGLSSVLKIVDSTFVSPDIINDLGDLRLIGEAKGSLEKLKLKADLWSKQGALGLAASASMDSTFQKMKFNGTVHTQNFNLGSLLKMPDLGRLTASLDFDVSQTNPSDMKAHVAGKVHALGYKEENIKNVTLFVDYTGNSIKGSVNGDMSIGKIDGSFEMLSTRIPQYKVNMTVEDLKVDKFYANESWKDPRLSLTVNGDVKVKSMSSLSGFVYIDDLRFTSESFNFSPGRIALNAAVTDSVNTIDIQSSIADISMIGQYNFNTIGDELFNTFNKHLPSLFTHTKVRKNGNDFTIAGKIKNIKSLNEIFDLPILMDEPITFEGDVATDSDILNLSFDAPNFHVSDMNIRNAKINLSNAKDMMDIESMLVWQGDSNYVEVNMTTQILSDSIAVCLIARTDSTKGSLPLNADLDIIAHFRNVDKKLETAINILPSRINLGKLHLLLPAAQIANKGEITEVSDLRLEVENKPYLNINGRVSDQETDTLRVNFSKAQLGDILKVFDISNVQAVADGTLNLTKLMSSPEFYTRRFDVSNIVAFEDSIGSLNVSSRWSGEEKGMRLIASLTNPKGKESKIMGLYYPTTDSLAMRINIEQFPLRWSRNFFTGLLNELDGSVSSSLSVRGTTKEPRVKGWLGVNDLKVGVDYTNVTYRISDTIQVDSQEAGFKNVQVRDPYGNIAKTDARISFGEGKLNYDLAMTMKNFMVLNTQHRTDSLFYGRVFTSGKVNIVGSDSFVKIAVDAKNEKNSSLNVQLPNTYEASDYDGIVYINVPETDTLGLKKIIETAIPMNLDVKLNLNPDIALGVIIDPATGDEMKIQGAGKINFTYDSDSEIMTTFGDYILSSGSVRLKLQKIATMEFKVQEGSRLRLAGDPMKTTFDIKAFKRVRADLATLDESFKTLGLSSTRVPVSCIINIKGDINKMDISYEVILPEVSDDIQQKVKTLIVTDEQKLKQFAYLVAFGSFFSGGNVGDGMLTSIASSTLSGGLNAVFGNILGDQWEIGTDIASSDGSFSDVDVNVNVSRRFLDGKLKFNTNLGYQTANQGASTSDNPFIGDFEVEYELSPTWKIKAYSETNDELYKQSSTTQGVGLVYTKEARTLKDLFTFFGLKKRKKKVEE